MWNGTTSKKVTMRVLVVPPGLPYEMDGWGCLLSYLGVQIMDFGLT